MKRRDNINEPPDNTVIGNDLKILIDYISEKQDNSGLMSARMVYDYLNGLFNLDQITALMKNNIIESCEKGGHRELITRRKTVDKFVNYIFDVGYRNEELNIDIMPRKRIVDFSKKKVS